MESTDEEQTAYALKEGRVIFTQDEDFLAIQASGTPHAGIAYCKKNTRSIGDMVRGLAVSVRWSAFGKRRDQRA